MNQKEMMIKKIGSAIDSLNDVKQDLEPIFQKKMEGILKELDDIYFDQKFLNPKLKSK